MFDDQLPQGSGQVPPNLPIAEPEDIFSQTEAGEVPLSQPAVVDEAPSALEAGILRPAAPQRTEPISPPAESYMPQPEERPSAPPRRMFEEGVPSTPPQPPYQMPEQGTYALKEPMLSRSIMTTIIAVIVLLILGGGGWWIWSFVRGQGPAPTSPVTDTLPSSDVQEEETSVTPTPAPVVPSPTNDGAVPSERIDEQLLFGEPIDRDSDGLDDAREEDLQLDPQNWDTDGDLLSDGDEVIIWKSNPLSRDTDGDSYLDGAEVKAGYSPTGPGRIFEPPTTTP